MDVRDEGYFSHTLPTHSHSHPLCVCLKKKMETADDRISLSMCLSVSIPFSDSSAQQMGWTPSPEGLVGSTLVSHERFV
jgi:hypothetical protein